MNQVFEESRTRLSNPSFANFSFAKVRVAHSNCFILFWLRTRSRSITKSEADRLGWLNNLGPGIVQSKLPVSPRQLPFAIARGPTVGRLVCFANLEPKRSVRVAKANWSRRYENFSSAKVKPVLSLGACSASLSMRLFNRRLNTHNLRELLALLVLSFAEQEAEQGQQELRSSSCKCSAKLSKSYAHSSFGRVRPSGAKQELRALVLRTSEASRDQLAFATLTDLLKQKTSTSVVSKTRGCRFAFGLLVLSFLLSEAEHEQEPRRRTSRWAILASLVRRTSTPNSWLCASKPRFRARGAQTLLRKVAKIESKKTLLPEKPERSSGNRNLPELRSGYPNFVRVFPASFGCPQRGVADQRSCWPCSCSASLSKTLSKASSCPIGARPRYSNRVGFIIILENTGVKWDQRCSGGTSFGCCACSAKLSSCWPCSCSASMSKRLSKASKSFANRNAPSRDSYVPGRVARKVLGHFLLVLTLRVSNRRVSTANRNVVPSNFAMQSQEPAGSLLGRSERSTTQLISFWDGNSNSSLRGGLAFAKAKVWQQSSLRPPKTVLNVRSKPTDLRSSYGNNIGRRRGSCSCSASLSKKLSTSKLRKQQGLAFWLLRNQKVLLRELELRSSCTFKTKPGLNKTRLNRRLKQPFTIWGFVMDTKYCRTEILGWRKPHSSEERVRGARFAPKGVQSFRPFRGRTLPGTTFRFAKLELPELAGTTFRLPERSSGFSGLDAPGLCNIVTKTRYKTIRPLLNFSRENLTTVCKDLRLPVYPDKSNKAVQYSRNRLREQILPAVKIFLNPKIDDALFKLAELLTQDFSVVSHLVNTRRCLK